mgnify:CR=1 FL=1
MKKEKSNFRTKVGSFFKTIWEWTPVTLMSLLAIFIILLVFKVLDLPLIIDSLVK